MRDGDKLATSAQFSLRVWALGDDATFSPLILHIPVGRRRPCLRYATAGVGGLLPQTTSTGRDLDLDERLRACQT